MANEKAAPKPWVWEFGASEGAWLLFGADGVHVPMNAINREIVTRSVNSFQPLCDALEEAAPVICDRTCNWGRGEAREPISHSDKCKAITAAIKLATGGTQKGADNGK